MSAPTSGPTREVSARVRAQHGAGLEPGRRWFNVGAVKRAHTERDTARDALGDRPDHTRFQDIVGAATADLDREFPVGSHTTYRAALTDEQAARFAAASNCRYVVPDEPVMGVSASADTIPGWRVRRTLRYWDGAATALDGTAVAVAVMDSGSSSIERAYMGQYLLGRQVFPTSKPPLNENYPGMDHGSLCASNAVSPNGLLLEPVIIDGSDASSDSIVAQGITWAIANGAQVISGSFGFGSLALPATLDALIAAANRDVVFYFAAGNDNTSTLTYPARYAITQNLSYVHTVGGYDMSTGGRWRDTSFGGGVIGSNWDAKMTGIAPSILVYGVKSNGGEAEWLGTSAATPCVANLCARLLGGGSGSVTPRQAAAALAATCTDLKLGAQQGGGLFNFRRAASSLGLVPAVAASVDPKVERFAAPMLRGGAAL